jgi:transglutaminase-like putative cysteine protease
MKKINKYIYIFLFFIMTLSINITPVSGATDLSITGIDYPEKITCGTPTTFTVNAAGGSGNYKYRMSSLLVNDGSEWVSVYDVSYGNNSAYQESNTFTFTFYASGTYYIRFSVMDMTTHKYTQTGMLSTKLVINDSNYPSVESRVSTLAAECETECSTDYEKALWFHDWIINNADYDYEYKYCSAEGVLARGTGTCEAYHRAYVMLLNKVGIETGRIEGNGHVWTAVKMDGKWYQVDTTWDDLGDEYRGTYYEHIYFGITDEIIGLVHSDHTSAEAGYESNSYENNYFIKTGKISQWLDPIKEQVDEKLKAGETEFTITINDSMPENYKNVIYNLVAYSLMQQDWGGFKLTASYADNKISCSFKEFNADSTDKNGKTVKTTKLTMKVKKFTMKKGEKYKINVVRKPKNSTQKIIYTSSNNKIATVSLKGVVRAKKKGRVTITAKSGSKKATCKIIIK